MKKVIVHIDRLVLNGFDGGDRDAIAEGLRSELGALLSNSGVAKSFTSVGCVHRIGIGNVQIGHDARPAEVGQQIAEGIASGGRR